MVGTPPAEAGTTGPPAAGEIHPPELVSRQEAVYPEKSRKRGEGGVVVLKVLVSEKGRVARVVIEQGIRGSELEARAIDAALRSVYRPATQDGSEVRAWITERFVFEP
jgi:protein TonB